MKIQWLFYVFFAICSLNGFGQITVGNGTLINHRLPFNTSKDFSYSQFIYTASEIGNSGAITGLRFYKAGADLLGSDDWTVYIGTTIQDVFLTDSSWISINDLTQVFSGTVGQNSLGEVEVVFTTPFVYNGLDNIVVAIDENTLGNSSAGNQFYGTNAIGNRGILYADNGTTNNPNPLNPPKAILAKGGLKGTIPNITFLGLTNDCTLPKTSIYTQTFDTYLPSCWREMEGVLGSTGTIFTDSSDSDWKDYSITGLDAALINMSSTFRREWLISPSFNLGTDNYLLSFDMGLAPTGGSPNPIVLDFDDTIAVVISVDNGLTWSSANILHTITAGSEPAPNGTHYAIDLSPYSGTVKLGFYARSTVYVTPKAVWLDNVFIEPAGNCIKPINLADSALTETTAAVYWNGSAAGNYQVTYGPVGTLPGNGTVTTTATNSIALSALTGGTTYQCYVRRICGVGDTSAWSDPFIFTTTCPAGIVPNYTQQFDAFLPNCWEEKQGLLGASNTVFTANDESFWKQEDFAKMGLSNAASTPFLFSDRIEEWLISPTFDLGTSNNLQVEFDVALTRWSDTTAVAFDSDDTLAFLISTDNGVTWDTSNIIAAWDDAANPSNLGTFVHYDLSAYSGLVKFGFYVASSTSPLSKKVFIDNFKIVPNATCNPPSEFTLSDITSTSVIVDWTAPTTSGVKIEYGPEGFLPGTGQTTIASTAPYTLTGLTPETTYDIYLQNICAVGDTSAQSNFKRFTTECAAIIPAYFQGFSTYLLDCWERKRGSLGASNTVFDPGNFSSWTQDGFGNVGTSGSARVTITGTYSKEWLISPTFDLGTSNTYDLTFDVALTSQNGTTSTTMANDDSLAVVISTDNGATWSNANILQTWTAGSEPSATGDAITLSLSAYSGNVKIGFYAVSTVFGGSRNVYIDNFRIDTANTCTQPTAITVSNIGADTAEISWTTGGAANAIIEYGPTGFTPGTGITIITASNPYTITGLDNLIDYQIYMRDLCGTSDTSYRTNPVSFSTTCPPFTPTYTQSFSSYIPDCWVEATGDLGVSNSNLTVNSLSNWFSGGFGNVGSTGAARGSISGINTNDWLISPTIDLGNGSIDYLVEFKVALTETFNSSAAALDADDTLALVISTDNGITWTQSNILKTWRMGNEPSNTGDYYAADLSSYTGQVKFGFYVQSTIHTGTVYAFIDDFRVLPIPSCITPIDIQVTNLVANSFDIGWTGSTNTQIEYGPAGFTPGSGTVVNATSNPFTISGLVDQTTYNFYVRAVCGSGDTSAWTLMNTVTTPCPIFPAPYFEGFDNYPANCWTEAQGVFNNGQVNFINNFSSSWHQDGFGNIGFIGSARLEFWLTNHDDWLISPSIDLGTSGNYRLEFDIALTDDGTSNPSNFQSDDTLFLYISTDDGQTWHQNDSLAVWYAGREPSTTGDFVSIDLSMYTGVVRFAYFGKSTVTGGDFNVYIDNFEIPACPRPFDVNIDTLTATSTIISWNPMAGNTFLEYGPAGFLPGTGTTVYSDSASVMIDSLTPIMDYEFYLIDSCDVGNISRWNGPIVFSTPCPNYVPTYTEDFTTFLPQCWEKYQGLLIAGNTVLSPPGLSGWTNDGFANNGFSGAARMNITGNGIHEWLVTPTIDLGSGTTGYQVEFDVAMTAWANSSFEVMGTDDTLALVISTDNGTTWSTTNILRTWTYNDPPTTTGNFELIELTAYSGLVKFGFYTSTTVSGNNVNVYIDNFAVKPIPPCQQPLNIEVINVSDTSAELTWTAGATSSVIEYGPPGFTLGTGTQITTTNASIINSLSPNTSYQIYILDSCSMGLASAWSGPIEITTNCQVTIPTYLEDFSNYLPDCWSEFTGPLGATGTIVLNPLASNWNEDGFGNVGSSGAARMFVYTPGNGAPVYEWLVSPSIDLGSGTIDYILEFDVALTQYLSPNPSNFDADDSLAVLISLDDGVTWSSPNILKTWEMGSEPSNTGDHVEINLSGYTGIVKFGFYATSTASGGILNVFIDNFEISICNPSFNSITETSCGPYTSPSGVIYDTSGIYSDTITNTIGCDSIITIDLTIKDTSSNSITETRCYSYTSNSGIVYTNSGIYTEVFTNAVGCDSTLTLNLTIIDIDLTVSILNGAVLESNESQAGVTYQWLDCDNNNAPIPGATNVQFSPTNNGNYACEITKDSCVDVTTCIAVTGVGLSETPQHYFSVFPNPTQGSFTLVVSELSSNTIVVISNTAGQKVFEQPVVDIETKLEVESLESGMYTIQVIGDNGISSKMIVFE